jgi:hypothetical protein
MQSFESNFKGADLELVKLIQKSADVLKDGNILVIDPGSNLAGYCYVEKLEIIDNGTIKPPPNRPISERLRYLTEFISERWPAVDAIAIEKIRASAAHHFLLWSVGASVAGPKTSRVYEISTSAWQKYRDFSYRKTDAMDAKLMATFVIDCIRSTYVTDGSIGPKKKV